MYTEKLKRFGCLTYTKNLKVEAKFEPRATKTILVGFTETEYKVWNPRNRKIIETSHVEFNEKLVYGDMKELVNKQEKETNNETAKQEEKKELETRQKLEENLEQLETSQSEFKDFSKDQNQEIKDKLKMLENLITQKDEAKCAEKDNQEENNLRRSNRKRSNVKDSSFLYYQARQINLDRVIFKMNDQNDNSEEDEIKYMFFARMNNDPTSYREALETAECEQWKGAVKEEFKKKIAEDGSIRHRARLVIRGYQDNNIYNLRETYAPVSRLPLVRALLAIINKHELDAYQLDVKTAFLYGELEEEIYMEIPDGYDCDKKTRATKVCKLKKSLYGPKISPKK